MDFVDLQRRREERAQASREPEGTRRRGAHDPVLLVGSGFVLGSAISYFYFHMFYWSGLAALLPFVAAVALLLYAGRSLLRGRTGNKAKIGSEKQLLMAIQDAGGTITPVEAALETSLTVDEAEEILTRFADRGHLVVQSQDGALIYTLPNRRSTPEPRTAQSVPQEQETET